LRYLIEVTLTLLILAGVRGSGNLSTDKIKNKCKQIYELRPYL